MVDNLHFYFSGTLPNITRNAVVNAAELVSYDLIKENLIHYKLLSDNFPCHFISAFGAGFITTCCASPIDVVKTRFMNSGPGQYKGALQCAAIMFKEGGPMAFYKGLVLLGKTAQLFLSCQSIEKGNVMPRYLLIGIFYQIIEIEE
jgi:solute carrier family 25 uncoupling protein 8/9